MSSRLVHASTPNTSKELRVSWDARFRCSVKDGRDVVYGDLPSENSVYDC